MSEDSCQFMEESESINNLQNLAPDSSKQPEQAQKQEPVNQKNYTKAPIKQLNVPRECKPRLIIDRIVLDNFKSYADRQVIGPFHENFTSVVGPNGSGKSNLIESMLFIFGYNASWMRLHRLSQLIHNSSTLTGVQRAAVEVQFKKIIQVAEGVFEDVPDSRFSIRRTVNTSSVSKYYLNNHDSTQAEVKQKLKSEGIDLNNNRFLILQGQVQQISQMKQKSGDRDRPGLLEYLEDIIGSSVYIDQIETSIDLYNKAEEAKHQKGEIMKIVEAELKGMSKGKEEAIRYVKKEKQIYQTQNILNQVIISNNKFENTELAEKLNKLQEQKERIVREERQKLKKQAERIKQIKKCKSEITNLENKLAKEKEEVQQLKIKDENIKQELTFLSEDQKKFQKKSEQLRLQRNKIINQSDDIRSTMPSNKQKIASLDQQIDQLKKQLNKHENPKLDYQLKALQNQQKKCDHQINSWKVKLSQAEKQYNKKFTERENVELKVLQLQGNLESENEKLQKIAQASFQANEIRKEQEGALNELEKDKKIVENELEKINTVLREQANQSKEIGRVNNMFEKIMQQKIPGVIGRLGDLGYTKKQYDQIITSCCGRLDNLVVQNLEAATAVLDFLKRTKLGRITCIILDTITQYAKYMKKPWQNLPKSVRLFDLVEANSEESKMAFYFALNDTIYCQQSQRGLEYSMGDEKNRRRVVSRKANGFIIYEVNGLMIGCPSKRGGFEVKAKTKMRNPTNSKELKAFENQKKQWGNKFNQIKKDIEVIKEKVQEVKKDMISIQREKKLKENKIEQIKDEISDLKQSSLNNSDIFAREKKNKQNQIEAVKEKINQLKNKNGEIQENILNIEKERKKKQNQQITNKRERYKNIRQQYAILEKEIEKGVAILQNTEKRIRQNEKTNQSNKKKLDMMRNKIEKLQYETEKIEKRGSEIFGVMLADEQKLKKCQQNQNELKVLFEEDEKDVRESKKKIDQAKAEVEICKESIKKHQQQIKQAQKELLRVRQTYRQLTITYDFMEDLEDIEGMKVQGSKVDLGTSSILETSLLMNQSMDKLDKSNLSHRVFPQETLLEISPFEDLTEEQLDPFLLFHDKLLSVLISEKQALKKLTGSNLQIINEFKKKYMDYKEKLIAFQEVEERQRNLKKTIEDLKNQRLTTFREGFSIINLKLKQVYQLLTRGGDAQLQLIDSLDPFSDGINFSVRPPKKSWKEINKLSGGEKTLSSLSLIFALHFYRPTPLYFMDQIDAALDFKNVSIVADYIKKRTKNAQFIIISLRNNMFDLADKLVGVYKTYDKTKFVQFIPEKFRQLQKSKENFNRNQ